MKTVIIIPSLNPDDKLPGYVDELVASGKKDILLIDDGSDEEHRKIFEEIRAKHDVMLLTHAINMGKGRALKDAFNYCLTELPDFEGVITVDSDGQHTVKDVIRMEEALEANRDSLILGARNFSKSNVPPKSEFGNKITRVVMKLLYGGGITDTQTGLRAMSYEVMPAFLTLTGERFEYETGMLIEALRKDIPIKEVEIETIYIEENKGSHFRPFADSWKIYKLILGTFLKYSIASLLSAAIDLGLFHLFANLLSGAALGEQVYIATIGARIISSLFNYTVNKNVVFGGGKGKGTIVKYYILCVIQMCLSAALVWLLSTVIGIPKVVIKAIVDTVLFLISFRVQKKWIFKD
ncbi:MAG: bifunctional glycosyltransferase family 2/GtrA family protein [Saccharofermentans sp.]|nr:bifunctional glycosyltransferase family 2/GtrA family protein [Saccharofermentans sp.]